MEKMQIEKLKIIFDVYAHTLDKTQTHAHTYKEIDSYTTTEK